MNRHFAMLAAAAALVLANSGARARATVLTFDGLGTNTPIPAGYGSHVSAAGPALLKGNNFTPNVAVAFVPNGANGFQTYNDAEWRAAQLDGTPPEGSFDVVFTPDAGYGVRVNSFQFDDYANFAEGHTFDWSLLDADGNQLAGQSEVTVDPDLTDDPTGADNLLINTGLTAFHPGPVTLRITPTAGDPFDRAIDNINFDQAAVPEPASLGVLALATGLLAVRRRR